MCTRVIFSHRQIGSYMPQSQSDRTKTVIPQNPTLKLIDLKNVFGIFASPLENLLSCKALNSVYTDIICERHGANFFQTCLELLHVRYVLSAQSLQDIPPDGPLIVVASVYRPCGCKGAGTCPYSALHPRFMLA